MKNHPGNREFLLKSAYWVWQAVSMLALLLLAAGHAHAATYYVATNGNNAWTGTSLGAPFRSLQKAMDVAIAGDTVYVRGGTYREQVDVYKGGGTATKPVVVMPYQAEVPVIKGSDIVTGWTQHTATIWKKTGWLHASQQVFVDFDANPGKPLQQIGLPSGFYTTYHYPKAVGTGLSTMVAGSFYYDKASTTLYVWLADGSNPNNHVIEASVRRRHFFMSVPYIHLKGFRFRHSSTSAFAQMSAAVGLSDGSVLENCDIQWTDFTGLSMGAKNSQAVDCNISNNGNSAVSASGTTNYRLAGVNMSNNNYRNFNPLWHAGGLKAVAKSYGLVEYSVIGKNNGSGIWLDHADSGGLTTIRHSYFHENGPIDSAIYLEKSKNVFIYNNVLVNNKRRAIYVAASDGTRIHNNTIVGTVGRAAIEVNGMPRVGATLMNNSVHNNIISHSTTDFDLLIAKPDGVSIVGNTADNNNYYRPASTIKLASGGIFTDLLKWQAATGFDKKSVIGNPLFVGSGTASALSYAVDAGSPAIDAGIALGGITDDYRKTMRPMGGGYDLGAFEKSTTMTLSAVATDVTSPVVSLTYTDVESEISFTATASDDTAVTGLKLFIDGALKATSSGPSLTYKWNTAEVSEGSHDIVAEAIDKAKNKGQASGTVTVAAGSAPPSSPSAKGKATPVPQGPAGAPKAPAGATGPNHAADTIPPVVSIKSVSGSATISASATDNVGVTAMNIYVNGVLKASSASGQISYTVSAGARPGAQSVVVSATDQASNVGKATTSVTVQ